MLKVGLTGNIGCGKSTVAQIFRVLGVPVFVADTEAKLLLADPTILPALAKVFGPDIVTSEGIPDKKRLAEIVFSDPRKRSILNSIIHPAVRESFNQWCEKHQSACFVIQEAAILYETGQHRFFDRMVVVTAPEQERIRRVMLRDGLTREEIAGRMDAQWAEEKKTALADFIIANDGTQMLIPQVISLWQELRTIAANNVAMP